MRRYLFSSHDGFGVGHLRRNLLIARALQTLEPTAEIGVVTGLETRPTWLDGARIRLTHVPALLKDTDGAYRNSTLSFEQAIEQRAEVFDREVASFRPDVVIVDRHPYGLAGELRTGLERAAGSGAAVVLGLRDVLDEPTKVRAELAGEGWADVADRFDQVLVYGDPSFCDHEREYGLPVTPRYCGWVVEHPGARRRDPSLLVVTAGGGGDGEGVFRLGVDLARRLPELRAVLVAGPYATRATERSLIDGRRLRGRVRLVRDVPGCAHLFARAGSVVQMAGYNSTFESLAAGVRPVLVPRRAPRREQAIRASRLAALDIADMVDEAAPADEVAWLLRRPRLLPSGAPADRGIRLDGATVAAERLIELAPVAVR